MSLLKSFSKLIKKYTETPCDNYLILIKKKFGEDWPHTIEFADWLEKKETNVSGSKGPFPCQCNECCKYSIPFTFTINGLRYSGYYPVPTRKPNTPATLSLYDNLESVYEDWLIEQLAKI